MTPIRGIVSILIGQADAMSSALLGKALERQSHFRVVGQAATAASVVEAVQSVKVDVALIGSDLQEGLLSGFDALRQVRACCPEVRPVMMIAKSDPRLIVDAFRAGAKGVFCSSQFQFEALCRCVSCVHEGQIWANSAELSYVMEALTPSAPLRIVNAAGKRLLARREEDVAYLVSNGFSNRDIAQELNLSEHTVKNYLFHIFDKLGISSRVELALYALNSAKHLKNVTTSSKNSELTVRASQVCAVEEYRPHPATLNVTPDRRPAGAVTARSLKKPPVSGSATGHSPSSRVRMAP